MRAIKEAQVYENLEITAMASDGKGIGRVENMVVFVEHTITGDIVDARVTKKKSGFREAKPIHFHQKSSLRREPICAHFGVCGGCKWQSLGYEHQLNYKHQQVTDALRRIAKVEFPEPARILAAPDEYRYRNKLEYTFSDSSWLTDEEISSGADYSDRDALGFHIPGRFDKILDVKTCHLQAELGNDIRLFIRREAKKLHIPFFNLRTQEGNVRTLLVRNNQVGEWMLCLSVTEFNDEVKTLMEKIKNEFHQIKSLYYAVNTKRNDTLTDIEPIVFHGEPWIVEKMEDLSFRIHPKSFYQTNSKQAYELYKKTRDFADIKDGELVYDLYTGTGTIALFIAKKASKVIGVEYVEEAVRDAVENAKMNGIENTQFFAGDMKDILVEGFFTTHGKPDVIITDPPRAGMHEQVTLRILESGAKRIVYVSCNPATQARDLAILDSKYRITEVQPVDMFPQTTHVENIVKLELRDGRES
ncbi:MAG: 23S rRNA (uracil(1939)-C(5))-methyltransferase RlmD [Bacteroidia bacterium]